MTLYVRFHNDLTRFSPFDPASLRDKLTDRGWTECGTCGGEGCQNGFRHEANHCPDCVEGLVPPEGMVEFVAQKMLGSLIFILKGDEMVYARAALVAAARWEREQ